MSGVSRKPPGSVYYDITWVGYLGAKKVPDKFAKVFKVVREARDAARRTDPKSPSSPANLCKAGEVDQASRRGGRKKGSGLRKIFLSPHRPQTSARRWHGNGVNMDGLENPTMPAI